MSFFFLSFFVLSPFLFLSFFCLACGRRHTYVVSWCFWRIVQHSGRAGKEVSWTHTLLSVFSSSHGSWDRGFFSNTAVVFLLLSINFEAALFAQGIILPAGALPSRNYPNGEYISFREFHYHSKVFSATVIATFILSGFNAPSAKLLRYMYSTFLPNLEGRCVVCRWGWWYEGLNMPSPSPLRKQEDRTIIIEMADM